LCALALVVGAFIYWLSFRALTDDGYITLDYARTLVTSGTWGMTPGMESNTATSPLNVLLLSSVMGLSRLVTADPHPLFALGVVTLAGMVATGYWWSSITKALRVSTLTTVLGLLLVLLSPLALSAIGLETVVLVALLIGMLAEAIRGRAWMFGVLAGLAVLTRLDAVVFVLVLGLAMGAIRRRWYQALGPMLLIAMPWFVTSWFVLGSAVPDTLAIKQMQVLPGGWTFYNGLVLFLYGDPFPAFASILPAAVGVIALVVWVVRNRSGLRDARLSPMALFAVSGLVYYGVYCLLNVPVYLWYYVPTMAAVTLFAAVALDPGHATRRTKIALASGAFAVLLAATELGADLANGLPWARPPIFGNFAMPAQYARIGKEISEVSRHEGVESPGELGTLVYFCHCAILDQFSDRGRTMPYIDAQINNASPLTRWIWELNYLHLDRSVRPTPAKYHLVWEPKWVVERPGVWNVDSPGIGPGHMTLYPVWIAPSPAPGR
jgi:hypothetical protein